MMTSFTFPDIIKPLFVAAILQELANISVFLRYSGQGEALTLNCITTRPSRTGIILHAGTYSEKKKKLFGPR